MKYENEINIEIFKCIWYNCSHTNEGDADMKTKSTPYHLEIQTHRKNPYGLLRTSYRENGKIKHKTIASLPGLSLEQLKAMQAALQNKVVPKDEFKVLSSREYGASYVCHAILKELELHKAIHSRPSQEWVKSSIAMIIGRLVFQGSKLSLSNCPSYSALWKTCGIDGEIDVETHCYEAMDMLFSRQEAIQKTLVKKHLHDGALVLYDITSCFMEGEYMDSNLVEFGYNRDKKRGHEQIVISLLCNKDGCPVAVEVFKGGTKDDTTVIDKINELQQKYGLEKIIFVGDRGMITQKRYGQIDHETIKVISALNHGKIQELCDKGIIQISIFDENDIVEVIDGDIRYLLCKNPAMEKKEAETRRVLLKKTTDELDKIIASTKKTKNSKAIRAGKAVNKFKMAKFIVFEGSDNDLSYKVDVDKIEKESALDGCYVVFTDVHKDHKSAVEAVRDYKSLILVEQSFRNLKTSQLEIRPIYHKTDDRIKCHVFICMLAYYVMWHMRQRLTPLKDIDGSHKNRKYSFDYVLENLKSIRSETVDFMGVQTNIVSTPNEEQSLLLNLLSVAV
jgi:transposase